MAGTIHYNKLIRDNIPAKIAAAGAECETRILSDQEFERELIKKVEEEASGMSAATTKEELIEEIADVLDVITEVKLLKGITDLEIRAAQEKALQKKGGFTKKLFLLWSSDDGYKTNEKKGA